MTSFLAATQIQSLSTLVNLLSSNLRTQRAVMYLTPRAVSCFHSHNRTICHTCNRLQPTNLCNTVSTWCVGLTVFFATYRYIQPHYQGCNSEDSCMDWINNAVESGITNIVLAVVAHNNLVQFTMHE